MGDDKVRQIIDNSKSLASTTFGAEYQALRFIYEVEKNHLRGQRLGFAVRPLAASPAETVTKTFTLNQDFEIILTDSIARADDDSQKEEVIKVMYDMLDDFFQALINTKLSLPTIVLFVSAPSMSEPEFIDDNKLVILRAQYTVRYRSSTT